MVLEYVLIYDIITWLVPSEWNRNNSSSVLGYLQESRLSQIKVLERRIAPPTIVIRQARVRRAEVCSRDGYGPREAPLRVIGASHLVARATAQAIVEQSSA